MFLLDRKVNNPSFLPLCVHAYFRKEDWFCTFEFLYHPYYWIKEFACLYISTPPQSDILAKKRQKKKEIAPHMSHSSSSLDVEKPSVSACDWKIGQWNISPNHLWQLLCDEDSMRDSDSNRSVVCTYLPDGVRLRLQPMDHGRWQDDQFHSKLRIPLASSVSADSVRRNQGLILFFEGKAREGIAVALSTNPQFVSKETVEVQLGAAGNTSTIVQCRGARQDKSSVVSIPSRVCHEKAWIPYWICVHQSTIYVGVGNIPGQDCIGYWRAQDNGDDNLDDDWAKLIYVGFGNVSTTAQSSVMIQKVLLTAIPPLLPERLAAIGSIDDLPIQVVQSEDSEQFQRLLQEYKRECLRRKARAEKFGTTYHQPSPEAFLPWSEAKRLRQNPEKGFITGLDLMSAAETAKRQARQARFGIVTTTTEFCADSQPELDQTKEPSEKVKVNDAIATEQTLDTRQAWDKEDLLRPQRRDPPESFWKQKPCPSTENQQLLATAIIKDPSAPVSLVEEKLHLSAIDWAAFKQIRNKDIMVRH